MQISVPYSMGFELEDSAKLSQWRLNDGADLSICKERWVIGSAVKTEGKRSLYISYDEGATCTFDTVWNTSYAYFDFTIPSGQYELSFDWRCLGGDETYMCAAVGIAKQMTSMDCNYERAEFPDYIQSFAESGYRVMRGCSRWQHVSVPFASNGTRVYRLYFAWRNKNRDSKLPNPVSACVDNIQITTRNCAKPANLEAEVVGDSVVVTWTGTSAQYCIEYRRYGREKWSVQTGIRDERFVIEGLDEGAYDIRVRGVCNDVDTSAYTYRTSFGVYYPDRHCINYVDLHGEDVVATYGTFSNPYANIGVYDTAFTDDPKYWRHTINWDPDEYDPRTGGRLKIVPEEEVASVRLGNWNVGAEGESLSFFYTVDGENASILLLKYAVVLEDPNHGPADQPHFNLEILDEWGNLIDYTCGTADFYADSQRPGWNTFGSVTWKDWTTIGLNLDAYDGERLEVRLTTRDCNWSGHFGYAYFTMGCAAAKIVSTSCGDDAQMSIAAPSGFAYEWFDKYDNPVPDSIKSEDGRTLLIDPSDTTTYRCHLTYIEEETCGFDLYSSTRPRFPIAEFEWQYEPANCQNRVKFINKSHIMTKFNNVTEHHYDQPCDEYEWDFGNGQVGSEKNPVVIFPNKGGFFNVVLYASIAEGRCVKDTSLIIFLPSIGDKELRIDTTICEGGYIVFGPQYAGEEREYVNVWKTSAGCDSTVYLNLHLSPQSTEQLPDTTICAEIPLTIDGQTYKSHESGKFYRFYTNQYGCDSTLWMNVTVLDPILPEITVREMSDSPNSGAIFIGGAGFDYYTVDGGEPQTADSITGLNGGFYVLEFFNDFGCSVVREAAVSVCMPGWVYQRWGDVLSLKNAEALDTDSATHIFTDFQWYKNNEAIAGANLSYLYVAEGLDPADSYYLEMTRVSNGEKVTTCPFRPTAVEDQKVVYVYPSPVQVGGTLTVKVSEAASLTIVNMFGDIALTQALSEGTNSITMEVPAGIYVVQVQIGSETRVCRISVIE
ncbi:MAG: T9SS type A sorting domain-containing protein [Paludibacteraceae bacterium]|nr:T9SS type A sorting domain-containing protein [Paludibacteraceae bacterium]